MTTVNWEEPIYTGLGKIVRRFVPGKEYKIEIRKDEIHIKVYEEHKTEFNPITGDLYDIKVFADEFLKGIGINHKARVYTQPPVKE